MRIDHQRRAKVGDQAFVSVAVVSENVSERGVVSRIITGYESDQWAVPGGAIWDSWQLEAYAKERGVPVMYGISQ